MTCDSHCTHLRSCVGLGVGAWLFAHLVVPPFHLASNIFSFALHTKLGLPHFLALEVTHCICGQPLNHVGTHFFCCSKGGEQTPSHNVVWNAFTSIVKGVGFYVSHEQTHVLLLPSLQSFCQWVDIMLLANGIHTLANIDIINPTQVDLVSWVVSSPRWLWHWWFIKGRIVPWLTTNGHVSSLCHRDIWVPTSWWLSSSMC
jgi:hypothetical protein